jgi:hypothetical protein
MRRRNTYLVLRCATVAVFGACDEVKSPTRPSSTIVRIDIAGPSSMAHLRSSPHRPGGRDQEAFVKKPGAEAMKIEVQPFARGSHPHMANFLDCVRSR